MLPLLTYPLALIGLASLPALAAIYLLRNRFRRRTVSSLMLWQLQERAQEGGIKLQRARLPWIFFLELLVLGLLVMAATGPRWRIGTAAPPLIVVLDDSVSMLSAGMQGTARERAIAALKQELSANEFQSVRLILAGERPGVLGSMMKPEEVGLALDAWRCRSHVSEIGAAIGFARELGHETTRLLVLTDQGAPAAFQQAERLRWRAVGIPSANFAFINAARSEATTGDRCLFEIANLSDQAASTVLQVTAGDGRRLRETKLEMEPEAVRRVILNLPPETGAIHAALSDDALLPDNEVTLLPSSRERIRVKLEVRDEALRALLDKTLTASGLRSTVDATPHLMIHDQPGVTGGTNTWTLQFLSGADSKALVGPFVVDPAHPLTQGLSLAGVVWSTIGQTNAGLDHVLVAAGEESLIRFRKDVFGRHQVSLNLDPGLSTLQQSPDWPILFWNLLNWRRSELPGLEGANFRPGMDVRIRSDGAAINLHHPDGMEERLGVSRGGLIARSRTSGLHRIEAEDGTWHFAVNFLAPAESDLRQLGAGDWGKWETEVESRRQYASALWVFGLLALSGILTHHYWVTRGRSRQ